MPSERSSPSGGWREVYDEMDVDASAEEPQPCCVCGRPSSTRVVGPYCRWHCPDRGEDSDDGDGGRGGSAGDRGREGDDGSGDDEAGDANDDSTARETDRQSGRRRDEGLTRFTR